MRMRHQHAGLRIISAAVKHDRSRRRRHAEKTGAAFEGLIWLGRLIDLIDDLMQGHRLARGQRTVGFDQFAESFQVPGE